MMANGDDLARFLAYAFQATGRRTLTGADFVRIHSFERRWAPPPLVRAAVAAGTRRGLLSASGEDSFAPGFDLEAVRLGFDYAPDPGRLQAIVASQEPASPQTGKAVPLFRRIVRRVAAKTNQSDADVVAAVNQQQSSVGGLWTAEVAALVYARLQSVDIDDLIAEALAHGIPKTKGT